MFEINSFILGKMGWVTYSKFRGIGLGPKFFDADPLVRFFITIRDKKICYLIKELNREEKQKSKKLYKFIILDYGNVENPNFSTDLFSSNYEMFSLIIKHEACNESYQRHFKINKIINEKTS